MMAPMRIADFALERYFARWEFAVDHLLCASDVQGYPMAELLALADDDTRRMWDGLTLGYTESTGHLLAASRDRLALRGSRADHVLVFAGAEEAIFCLANVLLSPGDHAVVTWPGYQSLYGVARGAGADVTLHELREEHGWAIDIDLLRSQVTPSTRLVVVNAPHNPTGMQPDRATFDALVALAEEVGAQILVDEVYRFLEFDGVERLPAGADASPRGISLGVMSKSFAMAGLRIGWLATRDRDVLERCARFKDYTTNLLIGSVGGARPHRASCARDGPCALALDRR
jgi:aspartate/methionine/tyrosine aminotransferase